MFELIYALFEKLEEELPHMKQANEIITQKIELLLQPQEEKLQIKDYDELSDLLFLASHYTKRELFAVGFSYAISLLLFPH